jgi:hypothetical protein
MPEESWLQKIYARLHEATAGEQHVGECMLKNVTIQILTTLLLATLALGQAASSGIEGNWIERLSSAARSCGWLSKL